MEDDMPVMAGIKAQSLSRMEAEAMLQRIALDASQGASLINTACIAFHRVLLMQDIGMDHEPLQPHLAALSAARDAMVAAVVAFQETLDEMESGTSENA